MKRTFFVFLCLLFIFANGCAKKKTAPIEPPATTPTAPGEPTAPVEPQPAPPPEVKPSGPSKPALPAPPKKPRAPAPGDTASNKLVESGVKQMNAGSLADAGESFEQALRVSPSNGRPYYYLGVLAAKQNQCERAIGFLEQAEIHLQGDAFWLSQVFMQEGLCYKAMKNNNLAKQKFQQALKQDPNNTAAQKELKALKP